MKNVKRLAAIPLIVLTFILFSVLGLLPKSISVKVPASLQTYPAMLPYIGFTVSDRQENEPDNKTFAKGAFDRLRLFENANIRNNGYYNRTSKNFVWSKKDELVKIKEKKADAGKAYWNLLENDSINFQPVVRKGRYNFFISGNQVLVSWGKKYSYTIDTGCKNDDELIDLLEKQTKERITMRELCNLLSETASGHLLRFNPDAHTALLYETLSDDRIQITSWNTATRKKTILLQESGISDLQACSDTEIFFYDESERQMIYYDFSVKKGTILKKDIDRPVAFNFTYKEGKDILVIFSVDNAVYEADINSKVVNRWNCHDQIYSNLICGKGGIFASNEDYHAYLNLSAFYQ